METMLYLGRIDHEVAITDNPDGTFAVTGLPILKPGRWNAVDFTAQHLEEMVANHARLRDELDFEPPLRAFHPQDGAVLNARTETLGHITGLAVADGVLKADATVYDADTVANLRNRRLRHGSAEVRLNPAGADGNTALRGLAFVEDPAVKPLPWRVVMNAAEYGEDVAQDGVPVQSQRPETPQGGQTMTMKDRMKAVLGLLKDVDLEADEGAETPTAPAPATVDLAATPEFLALQAKADAAETQLAALRLQATEAQVRTDVDALLSERYIIPAQQDALRAILLATTAEQTVTLAAGAAPVNLREAIVALLRQGSRIADKLFSEQLSTTADQSENAAAEVERLMKEHAPVA